MKRTLTIAWGAAVALVLLLSGGYGLAAEPAPGTLITVGNVDSYKEYIPEEVVFLIRKYGMTISVGEPGNYAVNPRYKKFTEESSGKVSLDANGRLQNYVSGLPFPDIDPKDPNAGLKVAWNYEYSPAWPDDVHHVFWFVWVDKKGKIERTVKGKYYKINYQNRSGLAPTPSIQPNPKGIRSVQGLKIVEPFDVAGTGFVQTRFNPNDVSQDDETVAYVPSVRRLRRLSAAQQYDAYLGTDLPIDDFFGYTGSVLKNKWKLVKKTKILGVINYRGRDVNIVSKTGTGWFPDPKKVQFELRDAYVLEAVPTDRNHPYSKRVIYLDAQFFTTFYACGYDKKGKFWKMWTSFNKYWPEHNVFTCYGATEVDVLAEHTTVVPSESIPNVGVKPESLYVSNYLKKTEH